VAEDVLEGEFPIAKASVGYRRRVQGLAYLIYQRASTSWWQPVTDCSYFLQHMKVIISLID
jgi:hypothetical protein